MSRVAEYGHFPRPQRQLSTVGTLNRLLDLSARQRQTWLSPLLRFSPSFQRPLWPWLQPWLSRFRGGHQLQRLPSDESDDNTRWISPIALCAAANRRSDQPYSVQIP